jgi:anaerobic magnesium-protoporphyrin IX monomethyl ester cyclase
MKVALLNPMPARRGAVNKDISGGFGTVSDYGDSPVARLMTRIKRGGVRYPVLSLAYAAAIFERAGWDVRYGEDERAADGADVALVYASLVGHDEELAIAERLRGRDGLALGFFGPFASVRSDLFEPRADFVVAGEPENALLRLAGGERLAGRVESAPIERLDSLPFPAWRHFGAKHFRYRPYFPAGAGFFPVLSSRGCTLSCAYYCPYTAVTGRRWRKRSAENVIAELEILVRDHGARRVLFRDPLFTLDRSRALALADGIREARLGLEWVCETHLDYLDEELVDRMRAAGLRTIKVGIESSDRGSLGAVRRHQPKEERIRRLLAHCDLRGVGVVGFYILGLPADTPESIEATIDYATELNTLGAQFTIATPYPGTGFFEDVSAAGDLLTEEWSRYDIYTPVMRHAHLSPAELLRAKARAYQRYYLRTAWAGKFLGHWWRRVRGCLEIDAASAPALRPVPAPIAAGEEPRAAGARDG